MSEETEPGTDLEPAAREVTPFARPPILPSADEFAFVFQMAEALARSQLVPSSARGKPADVAIVLLAARDMGIPLTMALAKLHVIEGRLTLSAEVMVALCHREGHRIWGEEMSAASATACAQRRGSTHVERFTFTIEDAATAGLLGKDNWKKYPKSMLWARAATGVIRMHMPEVTAGITYTPDEVEDGDYFRAGPAVRLDAMTIEELGAQIQALEPDQRQRLKAEWESWGLSPLSRLTRHEEDAVRELIAKAGAIDVAEIASGVARGPDGGDGPPEPSAPQSAPPAAPGAVPDATTPDPALVPDSDPEARPERICLCGDFLTAHGGAEGWVCRGIRTEPDGSIIPCTCTEFVEQIGLDLGAGQASPPAVTDPCPECRHALSAHKGKGCAICFCTYKPTFTEVMGKPPEPDTGHCAICGGPIWRDDARTWLHCDEEDDGSHPFGASQDVTPAAPDVDVDALYAAAHSPGADMADTERPPGAAAVMSAVEAMSPTDVMVALKDAGLSVAGTVAVRRQRWLDHQLGAVTGA